MILSILFSALTSYGATNPSISVSSNIEGKIVYLSALLNSGEQMGSSKLFALDLETQKFKSVTLPDEIKNLEIITLQQMEGHLYTLAQWTAGDGKPPLVYALNIKSGSWKKLGVIDCVSFKTISFEKFKITVSCEELNKEAPGMTLKSKSLSLPEPFSKSAKVELPIAQDAQDKLKFQLVGVPTQWSSIKIFKKNSEKWVETANLQASTFN